MEPSQSNQNKVEELAPRPRSEEFTVLGQGTIKEAHVQGPLDKFKKIGLFLIILILSFYSFSFLFTKFNRKESPTETPLKPLAKAKETEAPRALKTYTDAKNLFSIQHPINVTEGRSADDPLPVALELRYLDPVTEFKIGEEKPGWFLRISQRLENSKKVSLIDFAKESKLVKGEEITSLNLADRPAIKWRSAVYPQTFYLLDTGDGFFFIKTQINSQFVDKHQATIDAVLATLKFLEKPVDPDLGFKWVRRQFGDSWNLEIPEDWQVNDAGQIEGSIQIIGKYDGNVFRINLSYPIFENSTVSLAEWVGSEVWRLSAPERELIVDKKIKVAGTDGWITLNYGQSHRLYIWKRGGKNPSLATIQQTSGELNAEKMAALFERFVKGIK